MLCGTPLTFKVIFLRKKEYNEAILDVLSYMEHPKHLRVIFLRKKEYNEATCFVISSLKRHLDLSSSIPKLFARKFAKIIS